MNQDQDNQTTAFATTNGVLDENHTIWEDIPAYAEAVGEVKAGVAAIRDKQAQQLKTGETATKKDARDDAEETGLMLADLLAAEADKTGDRDLAAKVNFDKSALDRMAVSDLITSLNSINGAAIDHADVLATRHKIAAQTLTDFATAITKLDGLKDSPRQATVKKRVATLSMPDAIVYVRSLYRNQLDKMTTRFKKTEPDFYQAYFAARVIIDRTGTRKSKKKANGNGGTAAAPAQ